MNGGARHFAASRNEDARRRPPLRDLARGTLDAMTGVLLFSAMVFFAVYPFA